MQGWGRGLQDRDGQWKARDLGGRSELLLETRGRRHLSVAWVWSQESLQGSLLRAAQGSVDPAAHEEGESPCLGWPAAGGGAGSPPRTQAPCPAAPARGHSRAQLAKRERWVEAGEDPALSCGLSWALHKAGLGGGHGQEVSPARPGSLHIPPAQPPARPRSALRPEDETRFKVSLRGRWAF